MPTTFTFSELMGTHARYYLIPATDVCVPQKSNLQ
jgi:hypothetical protein